MVAPPAVVGASRPRTRALILAAQYSRIECGKNYSEEFLRTRSLAARFEPKQLYSMITVDCPEISNRFRQRMFLQAIMSSFRTM